MDYLFACLFVCSFVRSFTVMPCGSNCKLSLLVSCTLSINRERLYTVNIICNHFFLLKSTFYTYIISNKCCVLFEVENSTQKKPHRTWLLICLFVCLFDWLLYSFLVKLKSDFSKLFLLNDFPNIFNNLSTISSSWNFWWLICATKWDKSMKIIRTESST